MSLGVIHGPVLVSPFEFPFPALQHIVVVLILFVIDRIPVEMVSWMPRRWRCLTTSRVIILLGHILLRPDLASPLGMVGHTTRWVINPCRKRNTVLILTEGAILPARATEPKDQT